MLSLTLPLPSRPSFPLSLRRSLLSLETRVVRPQSRKIVLVFITKRAKLSIPLQFPEILLSRDTQYFSRISRVSRERNFFHSAVIFPYSLITLFNKRRLIPHALVYVPYLFPFRAAAPPSPSPALSSRAVLYYDAPHKSIIT